MLWSLFKILVFVAFVTALAFGAGYLMESPGGMIIEAAGTELTLGPLQSVIAVLVLTTLIWLMLKLISLTVAILKWVNGDETALSRYFDRSREQKGYQALAEGMMALASGEGRLAISRAQRAEKYLHKPELTDLLTAQAAEMTGDRKTAETVYKRLLTREETRFVGIRGLMHQKLEAKETGVALELAQRAFAPKPKHEEIQDTLLRLQAEGEHWDAARKTLQAKLKSGTLPRDVYRRRDAVLALSAAGQAGTGEAAERAEDAAIEANRGAPDLVPAAVMAARAHITHGRLRAASRLLRKAWDAAPHPDLAAAFAAIAPDETPAQRMTRFVPLTRVHPDHRETRLLLAELSLAAEDFPQARRALGDLAKNAPDARVLTIMAAIEKGEGADEVVIRAWLARAVSAPRGPQWTCDKCHTVHAAWEPLCQGCSAFDTLTWKIPPQSETSRPEDTAMLPLIIGTPQSAKMPDTPKEDTAADDTPPSPASSQASVSEGGIVGDVS